METVPGGFASAVGAETVTGEEVMTNRRVNCWGSGANLVAIPLILAAVATFLGISAGAGCTSAATAAPAQQNTSLDAAMAPLFATENFKEAAISPDGQRVAWVRSLHKKDGTPTPNSGIYVEDLSGGAKPRQISAAPDAPHAEHDLAWSPDCKQPSLALNPPGSNIFSEEQEKDLGDIIAQSLGYVRTSDDPVIVDYLAQIGDRVVRYLPPTQLHYRYFVLDSPLLEAFSIAGGRIYVSRGMIAQFRSPDETAAILAHEMGHLVTHQSAVDMTFLLQRVLSVSQIGDRQDIQKKLDDLQANWRGDPSAFRQVAHGSEHQQLQADQIGLYAMTAAGYSPEAFPAVFNRIANTSDKTGGWLSDFLHTTTPEQLRLREMLNAVQSMPPTCIAHIPGTRKDDFEHWRTAVLDFSGWGKRTPNLHGVLAQVKLDPLPQGDIQSVRFSPDGKFLLAVKNETIFIFTYEPFAFLFSIHAPDVWQPRFTVDSKTVAFVTGKQCGNS
jgi:hypothetical protein